MLSKYNPMSKEFQKDANRLGLTGNQYIQKLREEGKLRDPTDIEREKIERTYMDKGFNSYTEYRNCLAKDRGYENQAELQKLQSWNRGDSSPMSENDNCPYYLGVDIAERIIGRKSLPIILGDIEKEMSPNYPGFDFILIGNIKVDIKSSSLLDWYIYVFSINNNGMADYFLLIGINNRTKLDIMHLWLFRKEDIIRGKELYRRKILTIVNKPKKLLEFKRYEVTEKLKSIMMTLKEDINLLV